MCFGDKLEDKLNTCSMPSALISISFDGKQEGTNAQGSLRYACIS
jgi:hypothetical protein